MSPEDNEPAEPALPAADDVEGAAELALDEALSGEPVTDDGEPVEPLVEVAVDGADSAEPADSAPVLDSVTEDSSAAVVEGVTEAAPAEGGAAAEASAGAPVTVTEDSSVAVAADVAEGTEVEPGEGGLAAEASVGAPLTVTEENSAAVAADVTEPEPEAEPGADDPESDLVAAGDVDSLPDVTSDEILEAALEALLLVVDSPASEELLADTVGQPKARIVVALRTMAQKFTDRASGIDLRRVGEGWRFYTRDVYAPFVEKLLLDGQRSKLTRAALESLAVIAYRQPVTRARVAAVRGVNVDGVIRTLLARGLIEEMGTDPETTGTLYVTTELFLERLGLSSLNDLPAIAPLLPEVDTIDDIQ